MRPKPASSQGVENQLTLLLAGSGLAPGEQGNLHPEQASLHSGRVHLFLEKVLRPEKVMYRSVAFDNAWASASRVSTAMNQ
jgi:hypothetical protein